MRNLDTELATESQSDRQFLRNDPILRALHKKTPAEVKTHLEGITDPAERWEITIRLAMFVAHELKGR